MSPIFGNPGQPLKSSLSVSDFQVKIRTLYYFKVIMCLKKTTIHVQVWGQEKRVSRGLEN